MMKLNIWRIFSLYVWGSLPGRLQKSISKWYAGLYEKKFSRYFIAPYCKLNYRDPDYLKKFRPASGAESYQNFQDFFTRVFKNPPQIKSDTIWACEGLLCEYGRVDELKEVCIKGEHRHVRTIFGNNGAAIPDTYYFSNIFLHNTNYHRIHSPVAGTINRIERIPGDLLMLRPWIYKDPSQPALRNERVNIDIIDRYNQPWYLSIVGGPAVGTILLTAGLAVGSKIEIANEVAQFLLGSTCCIASPVPVKYTSVGSQVAVGEPL